MGELEPALKKTHELANNLMTMLGSQREMVNESREQLAMHQEKVKVESPKTCVRDLCYTGNNNLLPLTLLYYVYI